MGSNLPKKSPQSDVASPVAAMAYNLKKFLCFTSVEQGGMVIALLVPNQFYYILIYFCNSHYDYVKRIK